MQDNACPHIADRPQRLLKDFKWEIFEHSMYSPDLIPSDFHAFPQLKTELGGRYFTNEKSFFAAVAALKKNELFEVQRQNRKTYFTPQ